MAILTVLEIYGNLICGTDGSGVFMFKPEGSARIYNNDIRFNGRRFRRAAVYLMGNGHEVTEQFDSASAWSRGGDRIVSSQ